MIKPYEVESVHPVPFFMVCAIAIYLVFRCSSLEAQLDLARSQKNQTVRVHCAAGDVVKGKPQ